VGTAVRSLRTWLRYAAITGNVLYVLWIVRNGINEGFRGRPAEIVALAGLLVLLILNAALLFRRDA
jgi:hypothetical protein